MLLVFGMVVEIMGSNMEGKMLTFNEPTDGFLNVYIGMLSMQDLVRTIILIHAHILVSHVENISQ